MVTRLRVVLAAVALALVCSGSALAQVVPPVVKIQGFLTDRSGPSPVPANGTHSMLFEIFDADTGGLLKASVGPLSVDVVEGLYEAELPLMPSVFDGTPRYLQVTVNGEVLLPRILMVSVPYAFRAEKAGTAATVEPGSVDSEALADDAVTEEKIGVVCPNPGDVLVWNGTGWSCASPAGSAMVCPPGGFINCYGGPIGTLGVGVCQAGLSFCKPDGTGFDACA